MYVVNMYTCMHTCIMYACTCIHIWAHTYTYIHIINILLEVQMMTESFPNCEYYDPRKAIKYDKDQSLQSSSYANTDKWTSVTWPKYKPLNYVLDIV